MLNNFNATTNKYNHKKYSLFFRIKEKKRKEKLLFIIIHHQQFNDELSNSNYNWTMNNRINNK